MKYINLIIVISILTVACNNAGNQAEVSTNTETVDSTEEAVSEKGVDVVALSEALSESIMKAYFDLKDALVETEQEKAAETATVLESVSEQEELESIRKIAKQISMEKDIEVQRKYFSELSQNLYTIVKESGAKNVTVYKQYCPMAFDNTGAFWLSDSEEVINPYFGDKMLKCGKVEETIKAVN